MFGEFGLFVIARKASAASNVALAPETIKGKRKGWKKQAEIDRGRPSEMYGAERLNHSTGVARAGKGRVATLHAAARTGGIAKVQAYTQFHVQQPVPAGGDGKESLAAV